MSLNTVIDYVSAGAAGLVVLACLLSGCGGSEPKPVLTKVVGKVLLDGEPLQGAVVSFTPLKPDPQGFGRTSRGSTDADGSFSLQYGPRMPGALQGEHTVNISKMDGSDEEATDELLPARYNANSELKATVDQPESQFFEFKLESRAR